MSDYQRTLLFTLFILCGSLVGIVALLTKSPKTIATGQGSLDSSLECTCERLQNKGHLRNILVVCGPDTLLVFTTKDRQFVWRYSVYPDSAEAEGER